MIKRERDVERLKRVDFDGIKSDLSSKVKNRYDNLTKSQIEYLAGMGAAACATTITYPINKIIFRQSLWGFGWDKAIRQLRIEGITNLFRGLLPPVLTKSLNASVMFGTYNDYYTCLKKSFCGRKLLKDNDMLIRFISGMASGTTEAILAPLERIQMLLQDGRLNNQYRNSIHVFFALRRHGIREYYRGASAILLRNGPSTFLYFGLKDSLKDIFAPPLPSEYQLSKKIKTILEIREIFAHFMSGAILGACISTMVFPLNVIRIHMQTQEVGSDMQSIWRIFNRLYTDNKNRVKLYAGIKINVFRSVLYWGCITVFSESLRQYFHQDL